MKNYDEVSVVRTLVQKRSIAIDTHNKLISVDKTADEIGKNSWGKIDYLCNYCGYRYGFVSKTVKPVKINDDEPIKRTKAQKRADKLNMASMVKAAIKRK